METLLEKEKKKEKKRERENEKLCTKGAYKIRNFYAKSKIHEFTLPRKHKLIVSWRLTSLTVNQNYFGHIMKFLIKQGSWVKMQFYTV